MTQLLEACDEHRLKKHRSPVLRQLEAYEESWKKEHDALRKCWAWQDTALVGISVHSLLERVDRAWRDRVFRGVGKPFADEANECYRSLFQYWLRVTDAVSSANKRFSRMIMV